MPEVTTQEIPVKSAAETPIGEVFNRALAQARGETTDEEKQPPAEKPEKPAAVDQKPATAKKEAPAADPKPAPKSALDAALSSDDTPAQEDKEKPAEWKPEAATDEIFKGDKNWKAARTGMEQRDARISELQKQVTAAEEKGRSSGELHPETKAEIEALKTQIKERDSKLAEYDDSIKAINIELHPDYRREFITGRNELVASAMAKLKNYGGNADALKSALTLPEGKPRDEAVEAALEELSESGRSKILRTISEIEALDEKAAKVKSSPQQGYEALERKVAAQKQQQAEEAERVKQSEFERISRDLEKRVPTLRQFDEALDDGKEWNTDLKSSRERALALFSGNASPDKIVAAAIKGERYDFVTGKLSNALAETRKENGDLKARLAQYEASEPVFQGRKPPKKSGAAANLDKTPGELYSETLRKLSGGDED